MDYEELDLGPASRQIRDELRELPGRLRTALADAEHSAEYTTAVAGEIFPLLIVLAGHIDALRLQLGGDLAHDVRVTKDTSPDLRLVTDDE